MDGVGSGRSVQLSFGWNFISDSRLGSDTVGRSSLRRLAAMLPRCHYFARSANLELDAGDTIGGSVRTAVRGAGVLVLR